MKRFSCLASLLLGSCLLSTEYVGTAPADGGLPEAGPTNPSGDIGARGDGGPVLGADAGSSCVPGSRTDGVWRMLPAPTTDELSAVWGSGPNDVWVVSWRNTTAHHWNGTSWTSMVTPGTTIYGLNDLWGTGPSDVWAVGSNGIINHWDGTRWTASGGFLPSDHFWRVWGTRSDDVWAAGSAGLLAHWDGTRWTAAPTVDFPDAGVDDGSRTQAPAIQGLWGSNSKDVWAAGYQIFEHFDGQQWSTHMTTGTQVSDMWGSSPDDIWAVGSGGPYYQEGVLYHWDGASWSETRHTPTLHGVWGAHAKDVWVVGQDISAGGASTLMHWDGCTWSPVSTGAKGLNGLWGAQGHVWMTTYSGVLQYQPATTGVVPGFDLYGLDPDAKGATPVSLAVHGDVVGVTYFVTPASGPAELRYVELGKQPQVVAQVTNVYGGGTLAYDATGAPNVAYLGPPGNGGAWPESKAVVARLADGAWTKTVAASVPSQVVGLYSAIAIDGDERTYVAYRDVHYGQFPVQDFQQSRVGVAWGTAKQGFQGFTDTTAVDGTNRSEGHGGNLSIALLADQPMLAYSGMPGGATDVPQDVWFIGRSVDGWPAAPTRIRTAYGPTSVSLAAMPQAQEGWPNLALAWVEHSRLFLTLAESAAGTWSTPEALTPDILGTVSSASCAMDPSARPAVAYGYCSLGTCPATELRLAFWDNGAYRHQLVDPNGGRESKLAYWKGRAVIAYRSLDGTSIRLAVQR